jgi:pseudouridine-5'-phosphate glycosidase
MPYPQNLETAKRVEATVRQHGATPAIIAILHGVIRVGLDAQQLETLARAGTACAKVSRRDIAVVRARKAHGATTVAATMLLAHAAGIRVFVSGGIGGVHRGAAQTFDVSADLTELGRTPVAVVCAGAKSARSHPLRHALHLLRSAVTQTWAEAASRVASGCTCPWHALSMQVHADPGHPQDAGSAGDAGRDGCRVPG